MNLLRRVEAGGSTIACAVFNVGSLIQVRGCNRQIKQENKIIIKNSKKNTQKRPFLPIS
jgi:hypothetical protein